MFLRVSPVPYKNKEDQNLASKRYYEKNKEACIKRAAVAKKKLRAQWEEFKRTLKCVNCGFSHPAAIDFHHVVHSPDNVKVYALAGQGAYKRAFEEIKKCVPLCANCHRVHHYDERKLKVQRRKRKKSSRRDENTSTVKS
jgi:hypothetical protein